MKLLSKFHTMVIIFLITLIFHLSALLWSTVDGSLVLLIAVTYASGGLLLLWLDLRIQRSKKLLSAKTEKLARQIANNEKKHDDLDRELSRLVDLNTDALRDLSHRVPAHPHPRELRALDDLQELIESVENMRDDLTRLKIQQPRE